MQTATEKTKSQKSRKVKKTKSKKSKPSELTAKKASNEITNAGKLSDQEDTAPDPNAATNNIDTKESNKEFDTVDGSNGEESKQKQSSVEEILTEIINTNQITEDAQTEQTPEDTTDPGDAAAEEKNELEESLIQETDISSEQNDTVADPNPADGVTEVTAAASEKDEETAVSQIFEAIQKITQSLADLPGQPTTAEKSTPGSTGEIAEGAQTEQVPEETIDPEDAAGEDQNEVEESLTQEPDISSDQDDTTAKPNDTDSNAEVPAAAPEKDDGAGIDSTPGITSGLPEICANEIMQNQITWASPDDSLQQVIAKMQQTNAGYIMVGQNGTLEGIVSKSDISKAMSPYLLPIFAKWRRPLDDATLKIRIKWIMSRPVRTIKPETSLTTIMEHMSQFRERCLPVMDEEGNVRGLVTAFDVFQKLLKSNSNTTETDRTAQALVESAKPTETT